MWKKGGLVNRSEEVRLACVLPVPMKAKSGKSTWIFFHLVYERKFLFVCIYIVYICIFQLSTSSGLKMRDLSQKSKFTSTEKFKALKYYKQRWLCKEWTVKPD